jgi:glutathione S-transferase
MSDEIVFYTNPMSRGRIVRWMLEEIGQPYRTEIMGYAETMKGAEYLAINPMGKVPAIRHGDTVVTEGGAICAYLADAFPDAGLAPKLGDKARGTYFRWLFFAAGPIEGAVSAKSMGWTATDDKSRMLGWGRYEDVMNAIEIAVSQGDYLLGDRFSAADVYFGSHVGWGMQFGGIEKRPAFESYFARLSERPAAVRAREIDDALVAEMNAQKEPA